MKTCRKINAICVIKHSILFKKCIFLTIFKQFKLVYTDYANNYTNIKIYIYFKP